jgi:hypothetical protein
MPTAILPVLRNASAITTYGGRGVMKPGCKASEHTIVHMKGQSAQYLDGEWQKGMTKDPIAIEPAVQNETMPPTSRLRLGKTYTIECNVKVRDIGMVAVEARTKFLRYYQDEKDNGFEADDVDDDTSALHSLHIDTRRTIAPSTVTALTYETATIIWRHIPPDTLGNDEGVTSRLLVRLGYILQSLAIRIATLSQYDPSANDLDYSKFIVEHEE